MGRSKLEHHIQMSVLIPSDVYRQLHRLRFAQCRSGEKLPPVGQLIREALRAYVTNAGILEPARGPAQEVGD